MENSSFPSPVQHGAFKISFSRGGSSAGSSAGYTRHVFIDNSNIFISAGEEMNVPAFIDLLESNSSIGSRLVAGSQSSVKLHPVWDEYKKRGYTTSVHSRSKNSETGTFCETGVDAVLHAAILQLVLDKDDLPCGTHTIVLATGDGNAGNKHSSFPRAVKAAAKAGFRVEIWSWRASCATEVFTEVAAKFLPGVVTINYLDPHRDLICFVKKDGSTTLGGSSAALAGGSSAALGGGSSAALAGGASAALAGTVSLDSMTDARVLSSDEIVSTLSTRDGPVQKGIFKISFGKGGQT
jgi:hypothetical protein